MNIRILSLVLLIISAMAFSLSAQDNKSLLKDLFEEDRSAVDAIVLYPEQTRNAILEVSMYPELLIKLKGVRDKSSNAFRNEIKAYSKDDQARFYEVTRYPGLLDSLVANGKRSKKEIKVLLEDFPTEIHETAIQLGTSEFKTLHDIHQINLATRKAFSELIAVYPESIRLSIKNLVKTPEVLNILTDNMEMTILVGDIYSNDPEWVKEKARTLNLEVASRHAEELADYKAQLEKDTAAYQEMIAAADLYAKDNNIKQEEKVKQESSTTVVYSYSYWYGYPYWYTYPYWTPVPYYYHTGFYIGPGGTVIIIGLPSYHYVHWHYTFYPHRHVHLHAHYHRHYTRHPHGRGGFHAAVRVNVDRSVNVKNVRKPDSRKDFPNKQGGPFDRQTLDIDKSKSRDYDRFKTMDNHRGNWNSKRTGNRSFGRRGRS